MQELDKGTRKLLYFKSERRYKLYKAICKELGFTLSERFNDMMEKDLEMVIAIVEALKKDSDKQ